MKPAKPSLTPPRGVMTVTDKLTACKRCTYYLRELGPNEEIWYNQYCTKEERPLEFDPVEGEWKPRGYPHCREFNKDGHCPHYKEPEQ